MRTIRLLAFVVTLTAMVTGVSASHAAAEPLFTLTDDGGTFLYKARPGDLPSGVAEMFGLPQRDLPAFLSANGISDPTRVGPGFVYRIPNAAARALTERLGSLQSENARVARQLVETQAQARELTR